MGKISEIKLLVLLVCATPSLLFAQSTKTTPMQHTYKTLPTTPATIIGDDGLVRHGNIIDVSCSAISVTQGFAREAAIIDCKKSAAGLLDSTVKVNGKLWETKDTNYYHEESDSLRSYEGLDCQPSNEQVEQLDRQFKVTLSCRFDVSKAKALPVQAMENGKATEAAHAERRSETEVETENQFVGIATFPKCDKIVVVGGDSITCKSKAMRIGVKKETKEIIVETEGYLPYRIKLNGTSQSLMIMLSPL